MQFLKWAREAQLAGRLRTTNRDAVTARTNEIEREGRHQSDDPHVLALAQISGARLLYTNDRALQRDFNNHRLIDEPRGKVYTTYRSRTFSDTHQKLLANKDLCRSG